MSRVSSDSHFFMRQSYLCEFIGTLLLVCTVVGSGIMADRLSAGNDAVALLGNTIATGAILVVLISLFGPLSGAHFNPVVTMVMAAQKEMSRSKMSNSQLFKPRTAFLKLPRNLVLDPGRCRSDII